MEKNVPYYFVTLQTLSGGLRFVGNLKGKKDIHSESNSSTFQTTGEMAAWSGLYRIEHRHKSGNGRSEDGKSGDHCAEQGLFVLEGMELPPCPVCGEPATFHLLKKVNPIFEDPDFADSGNPEAT
jgi:hypothetical protein